MQNSGDPLVSQLWLCVLLISLAVLVGCDLPSSEKELNAFRQIGPPREHVNVDTIRFTERKQGSYQLVPGDLVSLHMPDVMAAVGASAPGSSRKTESIQDTHSCRVNDAGQINVPILGYLLVKGKTLPQLEIDLANLYCPKYLRRRPSVVARVEEYRMESVAVIGGVKKPSMYELRSDEMTLIAALGKAGGIINTGADNIQIFRGEQSKGNVVHIKVVHQTIPVDDPELLPGDKIVVQSKDMPSFTVIGLVKKPGKLPYPPSETYNVMQAIAQAGGLNELARPEHVKVYRQNDDGVVVSIVLKTDGEAAVSASNVMIKPGDIVAIEQTIATYTRLFLAQILNVGVGVSAGVGP